MAKSPFEDAEDVAVKSPALWTDSYQGAGSRKQSSTNTTTISLVLGNLTYWITDQNQAPKLNNGSETTILLLGGPH